MVTRRRWRTPLLVVIAAAMLSLAGCADSGNEPDPAASPGETEGTVYVGQVDAAKANIGLVVKDDRLAGFICQDENASLVLAPTNLVDDTATLQTEDVQLGTVSVADDIAVGTVDFEGSKHKFRAEPATGDAGVYRLAAENSGDAWDGWVVLNDGSFTGTKKSKPDTARPWVDPEIDP